MKMTDGKRTVEITIKKGSNSPDMSYDYFDAGSLKKDAKTGAAIVDDVDYCIDMATQEGPEGARAIVDEYGQYTGIDEDIIVDVTEINA